MFVGNPRGGRTAAILASLTSTCRRHDVDPPLYLTQLLTNLPTARMSELSAWLPDQWKLLQHASAFGKFSWPKAGQLAKPHHTDFVEPVVRVALTDSS